MRSFQPNLTCGAAPAAGLFPIKNRNRLPLKEYVMPNCTFHIVDAFTAEPFTGNPCAVVTDADGIDPSDMLRIARETNAPETAFVLASDKADVRVRYFMPRGDSLHPGHGRNQSRGKRSEKSMANPIRGMGENPV